MRAMLALLLCVWLAGCAGPTRTTSSISSWNGLTPTPWPPQVRVNQPNGGSRLVPLPIIELHAAGQTVTGEANEYHLSGPQGETGFNSGFALAWRFFPPTPLTVTVGQPISFTTDQAAAPTSWLWVMLDDQGNLLDATVLPGQQNTYAFAQPGDYVVKVLAQWDGKNYVAYLFRVVVNK